MEEITMQQSRSILGLLTSLVFLAGALISFRANAQSNIERSPPKSQNPAVTEAKSSAKKPKVFKTVDPCVVAEANANLNLAAGVLGVQTASDDGTYHGQGGCGLFVVDITVPSDSSGPTGFLPSFRIESGPTELLINGKDMSNGTNYAGGFALPDKVCGLYHQETRVFVKSSETSDFVLVKRVAAKAGSSVSQSPGGPAKCVLMPEVGNGALSYGLPFGFQPPKSGARVYRVAVGVVLGLVSSGHWQKVSVQASHNADLK
jgi:hypothetical protein